eukprot:TRINITY_DN9070_c0_g1_i1.p1 TRINITY_DN9070_c0_g1~~TRINITY_DN9070_c0_g1_i1.p1  ORF type:complete len:326 (+),score=28.73 TRINITY_DN9070_c0_g1_i1:311-1288(+)
MTIQLSNSKGPCIAGHTSHLDLASNQMFFIGGFSQHFRSSQLLQVYQFKPFAFKAVFGLGSNWLGCSVIHNDIIHIFNGAVSLPYVQFSISTSLQQYPKVFYPEYGARKDKEYFLGQCASLINVGGAPCVLFFGGQSGRAGETTNKLSLLNLETLHLTSPVAKGNFPPPRYCHASYYRPENNTLIIFGGWGSGPETFYNDLYCLDIDTWTWHKIQQRGNVPSVRCQVKPFRYGSFLFFVGGAYRKPTTSQLYGDRVTDCDEIYVLDLDTWVWVKTKNGFDHSCSVYSVDQVADGKFLITGGMHSDAGAQEPEFHSHLTFFEVKFC